MGITVDDAVIAPKRTVRDLRVTVDSHLQFTEHVNNTCKSAYLPIRNIGKIRKHLAQDDCERLVHAFITSKLDSRNSRLYGLPASCQLEKLQRVQNTAARLVTQEGKFEHISPILHKLHWLPLKDRIDFKLSLITFKALHGHAPIYIYIYMKFLNHTDLLVHFDPFLVIYLQLQAPTLQLMATEYSLLLQLNSGTPFQIIFVVLTR